MPVCADASFQPARAGPNRPGSAHQHLLWMHCAAYARQHAAQCIWSRLPGPLQFTCCPARRFTRMTSSRWFLLALAVVAMVANVNAGSCAKCNLSYAQGGCKCDSNCNCLAGELFSQHTNGLIRVLVINVRFVNMYTRNADQITTPRPSSQALAPVCVTSAISHSTRVAASATPTATVWRVSCCSNIQILLKHF
jgi:hypothetical protein